MDVPGCLNRDGPEEDVEAEHGEHDGQVAQDSHRVAQLVDQQEPFVDHPGDQKEVRGKQTPNQVTSSDQCD